MNGTHSVGSASRTVIVSIRCLETVGNWVLGLAMESQIAKLKVSRDSSIFPINSKQTRCFCGNMTRCRSRVSAEHGVRHRR